MKFHKAAVVGAGAMGSGIAQVLSQAGIQVVLTDVASSYVEKGLANIRRMYESRVKKEVLTQARADECLALIETTTDLNRLADVDLVIEAALEKIDVKVGIFQELDKVCPREAILATNTSALSISEIGAHTRHPERVLGIHFFNPAQVMKLVEVIPGLRTSEENVRAVLNLCTSLGKEPVRVSECPGFLVNRLLFPYLNEALHVLTESSFTPYEIDSAAVAFGMPMGPLTLLDMTGVDVCAHVNEFLYAEYGWRFATAPLLLELLQKNFLGQKSGSGIYFHASNVPPEKGALKPLNPALPEILTDLKARTKSKPVLSGQDNGFDSLRIFLPMFNEAMYALQENVVAAKDIDAALAYGTGLKRGLLTLAQENGLDWCLEKLNQHLSAHGERFRPAWYLAKLVRAGVHDLQELEPVLAASEK